MFVTFHKLHNFLPGCDTSNYHQHQIMHRDDASQQDSVVPIVADRCIPYYKASNDRHSEEKQALQIYSSG